VRREVILRTVVDLACLQQRTENVGHHTAAVRTQAISKSIPSGILKHPPVPWYLLPWATSCRRSKMKLAHMIHSLAEILPVRMLPKKNENHFPCPFPLALSCDPVRIQDSLASGTHVHKRDIKAVLGHGTRSKIWFTVTAQP